MAALAVVVAFGVMIVCSVGRLAESFEETRLFETLMQAYDRNVRPVTQAMEAVNVSVYYDLHYINQYNKKNGELTTTGYFQMEWSDLRLVWDPSQYGDVTKVYPFPRYLWIPDILLYNSLDPGAPRIDNSFRAVVSSDGLVILVFPVILRSICPPNDTVTQDVSCILEFGSWVYDGAKLNISSKNGDLSNYIEHPGIEFKGYTVKRNVEVYTCCPEPYMNIRHKLSFRMKDEVKDKPTGRASTKAISHFLLMFVVLSVFSCSN